MTTTIRFDELYQRDLDAGYTADYMNDSQGTRRAEGVTYYKYTILDEFRGWSR